MPLQHSSALFTTVTLVKGHEMFCRLGKPRRAGSGKTTIMTFLCQAV
jgi:hypothetical protein